MRTSSVNGVYDLCFRADDGQGKVYDYCGMYPKREAHLSFCSTTLAWNPDPANDNDNLADTSDSTAVQDYDFAYTSSDSSCAMTSIKALSDFNDLNSEVSGLSY